MEAVGGKILDDNALQLAKFQLVLSVVAREGVDVVLVAGLALDQLLDIGEEGLLLKLHVIANGAGILVEEFHDQTSEVVALVEGAFQFAPDGRKLVVEVVLVARTEILDERGQGNAVGIVEVAIAIDREIDDGEEGIGIYLLLLADLADRLVAKTKMDAKAAETLEQVVIVADKADHLILFLVCFLNFHLVLSFAYTAGVISRCKVT